MSARLLPAVASTPLVRKGVLGVAGLAFGTGLVAGPASAAQAAPVTEPAPVVRADKPVGARILPVDYQEQSNFYFCGPAAVRNALSTVDKDVPQEELARIMGTTEAGTDSAHEITRGLNEVLGEDVYRTTEIPGAQADQGQTQRLADDVRASVDAGRAVVVNVAGTVRDTEGGLHSFPGGHYVAVTGYADDGRTMTIADSADADSASYQVSTEALADWIATRGYSH